MTRRIPLYRLVRSTVTLLAMLSILTIFPALRPLAPPAAHASLVPSAAAQPAANSSSCTGYKNAGLPRSANLSNPTLTADGFFRAGSYNVGNPPVVIFCLRYVRMWVRYTARATKTWQVYVSGKLAASRTFTLNTGYYFWTFTLDKDYTEPSKICTLASGTSGHSCVHFTYLA